MSERQTMSGREALALAQGENVYCPCGLCLTDLSDDTYASRYDPANVMPHWGHHIATQSDLDHDCTWTRGECDKCDEDLPLATNHDHPVTE